MGVVFQARERSLQRDVAIKIVTADPLLSLAGHRRFQVEVESVAMLDHPNIVPIFGCGSVGPYRFFTMKLINGVLYRSGETISLLVRETPPN